MTDRKLSKTPDEPTMFVSETSERSITIELAGPWADLTRKAGSQHLTVHVTAQVACLGSNARRIDDAASNAVVGFVAAMNPRDPAEVLLLTQMGAIHNATMMLARRLNHVETIPQQDAAEKALNKLARTFTGQMDTLKRYRSKGRKRPA